MELLLVIPLFLIVALVIRLAAGASDDERIKSDVAARGGTVTGITWEPFGKGWFGDKNNRIYRVSYRDRDGNGRTAWCKTSMLSGVYFSEDRPVEVAGSGESAAVVKEVEPESAEMQREVEDLRAENEELKRKLEER